MKLELNSEQEEILGRVLSLYISDLRMEVAATDDFEFRRNLKHEEEQLKALLAGLQTVAPQPSLASS